MDQLNDEFTPEEKDGFYKAIFSRRDVRRRFTSRSIDEKVLSKIMEPLTNNIKDLSRITDVLRKVPRR